MWEFLKVLVGDLLWLGRELYVVAFLNFFVTFGLSKFLKSFASYPESKFAKLKPPKTYLNL
jgi:hypothetical protein